MQKTALLLACLVLPGHGQQRQATSRQLAAATRGAVHTSHLDGLEGVAGPVGSTSAVESSRALALLLLASGSVAAYTPSAPGVLPCIRRHGLPMMAVKGREAVIDNAIRAEQLLEEKDPRTLKDSWRFARDKKLLDLEQAEDMDWMFVEPSAERAYALFKQWYTMSLKSDWSPKSDNAGAPHLFAVRKKFVQYVRHMYYLAQISLKKVTYDDLVPFPKNDAGLERFVDTWKRTSVMTAISIDFGSALALISKWDTYWSIDCIVVNPEFITEGEYAERALLQHIGKEAVKSGIDEVRLPNPVEQYDDDFYEKAGYFPMDGDLSFILKYNPDHAKESS